MASIARRCMRRIAPGVDALLAAAVIATSAWYLWPGAGISQPQPAAARAPSGCTIAEPSTHEFAFAPFALERPPAPPAISASSAAVIDAATGHVLYGRRMNEQRPPASTTKIMTGLLSVEAISDENAVVVSSTDATAMVGSSVMGLWPAAQVTLRDLLYGLMLPSGNDAAVELSRHLAPSEADFVRVMNERAALIGMRNTHFANPHGLDQPDHYSSAYDMALLARHAMTNPRFREIAGTRQYHIAAPFDYDVHNGNSLLDLYPGAEGVKIGWTEAAGWTFVASAQRDGREVIVSLMNTADRDADAAALFDWAFASPYWRESGWNAPHAPRLSDRLVGRVSAGGWLGACALARP